MAKDTTKAKDTSTDAKGAKDAGETADVSGTEASSAGITGTRESTLSGGRGEDLRGFESRADDPVPFAPAPTARQVREADAALQEADDDRREAAQAEDLDLIRERNRRHEERSRDVKVPSDFLNTGDVVTDHPATKEVGEVPEDRVLSPAEEKAIERGEVK